MVINAVKGLWDPRQINNIIHDITRLLQELESWHISHIYREANRAADWIANARHLVEGHFPVLDCTHSTLHNILVTNKVGASLVWRVS